MKTDTLQTHLTHPESDTRRSIALMIGLVEETLALGMIRYQYQRETDPTVKKALVFAGNRAHAAQQRGYSTLMALFEYFNVAVEWTVPRQQESAIEDRFIQNMQSKVDHDMTGTNNRNAIGGALAGFAVGGVLGAALMSKQASDRNMMAIDNEGTHVTDDALLHDRRKRRIPPPMPGKTDIRVFLQRLETDPVPANRIAIAQDMVMHNNPAALPVLARQFVVEPEEAVQQALELAGKQLYWQAIYYQMTQDGSLEKEIMQRRQAAGLPPKPAEEKRVDPVNRQSSPEEAAAILARAEEEKRRKKQR